MLKVRRIISFFMVFGFLFKWFLLTFCSLCGIGANNAMLTKKCPKQNRMGKDFVFRPRGIPGTREGPGRVIQCA